MPSRQGQLLARALLYLKLSLDRESTFCEVLYLNHSLCSEQFRGCGSKWQGSSSVGVEIAANPWPNRNKMLA